MAFNNRIFCTCALRAVTSQNICCKKEFSMLLLFIHPILEVKCKHISEITTLKLKTFFFVVVIVRKYFLLAPDFFIKAWKGSSLTFGVMKPSGTLSLLAILWPVDHLTWF